MLTLCLILPLLTSCAATTADNAPTTVGQAVAAQPIVIDTACDWVRVIRLDFSSDVLSPETARQILAHNRAVKALCLPATAPAK